MGKTTPTRAELDARVTVLEEAAGLAGKPEQADPEQADPITLLVDGFHGAGKELEEQIRDALTRIGFGVVPTDTPTKEADPDPIRPWTIGERADFWQRLYKVASRVRGLDPDRGAFHFGSDVYRRFYREFEEQQVTAAAGQGYRKATPLANILWGIRFHEDTSLDADAVVFRYEVTV